MVYSNLRSGDFFLPDRRLGLFIKITKEHEAESTFLKNKDFVFVTFRLPQVN